MPINKYPLENDTLIVKACKEILEEKLINLILMKFDLYNLKVKYPETNNIDEHITEVNNQLDKLKVDNKGAKEMVKIIELEAKLADLKKLKAEFYNTEERIPKVEQMLDELQKIIKNPNQLYG